MKELKEAGMERVGRMDRGDGIELAWSMLEWKGPCVVFLPGFNSDMAGSKATALRDWCAREGRAMLRLDYSGHGVSGGAFRDGSIGRWMSDALLLIDRLVAGQMLLVGSSMGGWIGLLIGLRRKEKVVGLVGIAAAPDFTELLMWNGMTEAEQRALMASGMREVPSQYGDPYVITRGLIEDGRTHLVLGGAIALACPIRLLQGQLDEDVPWAHALMLAERVDSTDVQVTLIKDGDHRLSRESDIALLCRTVAALLGEDGGEA
jgi:pimeloyl-ACP methyl ester carboxylesterase